MNGPVKTLYHIMFLLKEWCNVFCFTPSLMPWLPSPEVTTEKTSIYKPGRQQTIWVIDQHQAHVAPKGYKKGGCQNRKRILNVPLREWQFVRQTHNDELKGNIVRDEISLFCCFSVMKVTRFQIMTPDKSEESHFTGGTKPNDNK